jgi:hypothetical protein
LAQCYYHGKKDVPQAQIHWNKAISILAERNGPYAKYLKGRCHWGLALIFYFDKKSLAVGSDHAYQAGKLFIESDEKECSLQMVDLIKSCDPSSPLSTRLTDYIYSKEENAQKSTSPVK